MGQFDQGRRQEKGEGTRRGGVGGGGQGHRKKSKPGLGVDPEGAGLVAGTAQPQLSQQPVRHSLWEQTSLEAYNDLLFGCLDPEVAALQQDTAEYDEARRQSDGGDTSGDCSDDGSGSVAELVAEGRPGHLQPISRKRVSRGRVH